MTSGFPVSAGNEVYIVAWRQEGMGQIRSLVSLRDGMTIDVGNTVEALAAYLNTGEFIPVFDFIQMERILKERKR